MSMLKCRFIILISFFFVALGATVYGQDKLTMVGHFEDENIFFSVDSKAVFYNGDVVVVDLNRSVLHRFSDSGELTQVASRQGRGPGEVGHPAYISKTASGDALLILDNGNQLVHEFSLSDFSHLNSRKIDFLISALSRASVIDGYLALVGSKEGSDELIHLYDFQNFGHAASFAEFIDWDATGIETINPMIRSQLYTGSVIGSGQNLIVNIDAPYIIRKYDSEQNVVWEVEDAVFEKPWDRHIKVTPEQYSVGMYSRIWTMKPLDQSSFLVQYVVMEGSRDDWEYWIDVRSVADGNLMQRFMLPEQMLVQDAAIGENGDVNLLFKNVADYTFASYRLKR
ncbi:MAG: 6-bladed beta-propeller [Balneolales bacterium]|nr:6-bladed beta-propeller [Balneolales bacterium]